MSTKVFSFQHIFFKWEDIYTETNPPAWIVSKDFVWFFKEFVLTLEIGASVDTDFQRITRLK